ncbi:MAG: acylphosphatase [Candidatus Altiarchaeia archaeon]
MDKRIVIEGGKVHGVGFRPLLYRMALRFDLQRFDAENVLLDGSEAVDVSFGGDEKAVKDYADFCRAARPKGSRVLRVREEEPGGKILDIGVYDRILASDQQHTIVMSGIEIISMQKENLGVSKENLAVSKESIVYAKEARGLQEETVGVARESLAVSRENLGYAKDAAGLLKENSEKLDAFNQDTTQRFEAICDKYGRIASNLERILEEMKDERLEARKSTERIIAMIASMKSGGVVREKKSSYGASKKGKKKG